MLKLICDNRESKIIPLIQFPNKVCDQLTIGDYAITISNETETKYLAVIERKSLSDYAASIKDGRIENIQKLLEFREQYGSRVVLIIEGVLGKPETKHAGIPYKNIESSIWHIILQHGISVMWSKSPTYTAEMLVRLAESSMTYVNKNPELSGFIGSHESAPLKKTFEKSDSLLVRSVLKTLYGLTLENTHNIIKHYSLYELISGVQFDSSILNSKTNKKFNKRALESLNNIDGDTIRKMLAELPGVGPEILKGLYQLTILDLVNYEVLSQIPCGNGKFGVRAQKIVDIMQWKDIIKHTF